MSHSDLTANRYLLDHLNLLKEREKQNKQSFEQTVQELEHENDALVEKVRTLEQTLREKEDEQWVYLAAIDNCKEYEAQIKDMTEQLELYKRKTELQFELLTEKSAMLNRVQETIDRAIHDHCESNEHIVTSLMNSFEKTRHIEVDRCTPSTSYQGAQDRIATLISSIEEKLNTEPTEVPLSTIHFEKLEERLRTIVVSISKLQISMDHALGTGFHEGTNEKPYSDGILGQFHFGGSWKLEANAKTGKMVGSYVRPSKGLTMEIAENEDELGLWLVDNNKDPHSISLTESEQDGYFLQLPNLIAHRRNTVVDRQYLVQDQILIVHYRQQNQISMYIRTS